jgi:hypothetical protein
MSLPLAYRTFMRDPKGGRVQRNDDTNRDKGNQAREYAGGHQTTTLVVDRDPDWKGFDPVSWMVLTRDIKDGMTAPKELQASSAGKSSGAKGGFSHVIYGVPTLVLVPHTTEVIRFRAMNYAANFLGYQDVSTLSRILKARGIQVYDSGAVVWLESHKTPLRAVGRKVVDFDRMGQP